MGVHHKMQITYIRIKQHKGQSRLKGIASITFNNCFVIHNIKIIEGDKGIFIAMPSTKNSRGKYLDIAHPINSETRNLIEEEIKKIFDQMIKNYKEQIEKELSQNQDISKMKITYIKIKKHEGESRLKGIASITFDNCFVVHNIKIIEGDRGIFIAMPSQKNPKVAFSRSNSETNQENSKENYSDNTNSIKNFPRKYLDIAHPINSDTRKMIEEEITKTFHQMIDNNEETKIENKNF
jgi:stage V sporulation protein G